MRTGSKNTEADSKSRCKGRNGAVAGLLRLRKKTKKKTSNKKRKKTGCRERERERE